LSRPGLIGPIIGPRTAEHLDGALQALDVNLDEATLAELDKIFPPHQPSPEDYAW
jgi:aryl-alcohol dehydrogenase-like predicted oxidoreductase